MNIQWKKYLAMVVAKPEDTFDGIQVNLEKNGCGRNKHFTHKKKNE